MLSQWITTIIIMALAVCIKAQKKDNNEHAGHTHQTSKPCGLADKRKFNENLLNLFRAEYGKASTSRSDARKVLNWKFATLDQNDDLYLQKPEYKELRRMKRLVKPKQCAKAFARACDRDRDSRISKEEWSTCMGFDSVNLRSSIASLSDQKKKDEPELNDCLTDRETVLGEQPLYDMYVPDCTDDGRYEKVQCYRSTGYCWCVTQDDGEPIPGTSVRNATPDCDAVPTPARPIKGCPNEKKEAFLNDLAVYLKLNDTRGYLPTIAFTKFDTNGNKYLDRKEWRDFRSQVSSVKELRRCGRKLPKYCDVNNDNRISLTEWINCLKTEPRRRGPNPLDILKSD